MAETTAQTRTNPVLDSRRLQLTRNQLSVAGGKPYIEERLSRYPSESDTSWLGNAGMGVDGRKDRAFNINYPRRITTKLGQYVFGQPIIRDGANPDFIDDVTREGDTVNEFMEEVNKLYTSMGWCWVSCDRGAALLDVQGNQVTRSIADRQASGDSVYWQAWSPQSVPDWAYSKEDGRLLWVITETECYDGTDPNTKPTITTERNLWERGGKVTRFTKRADASDWTTEELTYTGSVIPFHMVGKASVAPWWFDEVELLQAAMLNMQSSDFENINQAVFPQLVMPAGTVEWIMSQGKMTYERAAETVRGLNYPLFEQEGDKGVCRFIQPSGFHMKTIPDKIEGLVKDLYDVVGLAMTSGGASAQVQSAESKRWDNLDPEATLKALANRLESAERALVGFSKQLDAGFSAYDPLYSRAFDLTDVKELSESLLNLSALALPMEADKELQKAGVKVLGKVTQISRERHQELIEEIDAGDESLQAIARAGISEDGA